jgi:hypothetical protein
MIRSFQLVRRSFIVAALLMLACDSPFGPSGDVNVRVANNSSFPFDGVEVVFPENEVDYGSVSAHGVSRYAPVETAYQYAYIEVQIGDEVLKIQPIDYVGEKPLGPGFYTYRLNVTVEGHLTLEFREDR